MVTQNRYMNELFRIINGALRLDIQKVRNYTAFLADKLEAAGDDDLAARLRKLLEETDHELRPAHLSSARALPVDSESRFPLLEPVNLKALKEPPVLLTAPQTDVVQEFLSVAKCHAELEGQNISGSMSLLIYGPPGCGKSRLARFVAQELELPLYIARLDGLISSFLGSTAKNIRALFEFASRTPCVLFLDEFDAIAKLRGDTNELGELKRVVNSFVQNLDTLGSHSIVIAATNHEELLDSAVWRRFSYRIEFTHPTAELRGAMWEQFLKPLNFSHREIDLLVNLSDGFSGSDIQDVCVRLHRKRVVTREEPGLHDAFQALQNLAVGEGAERRFLAELKDKEPQEIATILRARDPNRFSYNAISQLLGKSKQTAIRWVSEGVTQHA
jgi:ATPase family protein associated with various cellular activities (AAA)